MQKTLHPESQPRGTEGPVKNPENLGAQRPGGGRGVLPPSFPEAGAKGSVTGVFALAVPPPPPPVLGSVGERGAAALVSFGFKLT